MNAAAIVRNIQDLARTCQDSRSDVSDRAELTAACYQWCNLGIAMDNRRLAAAINGYLRAVQNWRPAHAELQTLALEAGRAA